MNKRLISILLGLAIVMPAIASAVTIEGTLVDTKCYSKNHMNVKNDHKTPKGLMPGCAAACAKMGIPAAVLSHGKVGGDLFVIAAPAPQFASHMGHNIKVTGKQVSAGIIVPDMHNGLQIQDDTGKWVAVHTGSMM